MTDLNLNELRQTAHWRVSSVDDDGTKWTDLRLKDVLTLLDRVAELEAKVARVEALRQAAEVVVLDAGDEATGPEPDPNLAELAHCVAALAGDRDE